MTCLCQGCNDCRTGGPIPRSRDATALFCSDCDVTPPRLVGRLTGAALALVFLGALIGLGVWLQVLFIRWAVST